MSDRMSLSVRGTARLAFEGLQGAINGTESEEPFIRRLKERVGLYNLPQESVHIATELVAWQPGLESKQWESLILLVLASIASLQEGSTRMPVGTGDGAAYLKNKLAGLLLSSGDEDGPSPTLVERHFLSIVSTLKDRGASAFIGVPGDFKPLVLDGKHLYHQKMRELEVGFVKRLVSQLSANVPHFSVSDIERGLSDIDGRPYKLSGDQRTAIMTALSSPLTVLSGGPGTGKTSVIVSMLRVLIRLGVQPTAIALATPTGKAAHRVGEAIKKALPAGTDDDSPLALVPAPKTIHRLLGYSPRTDRFNHHENNRLSERIVIIDESSMVDLFLMDSIMRSLRDDGRLILIGDSEQLPSVDAGAVFRDLVPEGEQAHSPMTRHAARLSKNFRTDEADPWGSNILAVAGAVKRGDADTPLSGSGPSSIVIVASASDLAYKGVEILEAANGGLPGFLSQWHERMAKGLGEHSMLLQRVYNYGEDGFPAEDAASLDCLFGHFDNFKVICLTRVYASGTDTLNAFFHERIINEGKFGCCPEYVPGEPIMMQQNDYARGIFNGDQGLVLRVADRTGQQHFMAVFRALSGYTAFHLESLRGGISHSFAITVHKSQGSEYDHVALILPETEVPILTREILYTAITRSRRSVTIIGSREMLTTGISRSLMRFSGITERLQSSM